MWVYGPGSEVGLEGERLGKWHQVHGGIQWGKAGWGQPMCVGNGWKIVDSLYNQSRSSAPYSQNCSTSCKVSHAPGVQRWDRDQGHGTKMGCLGVSNPHFTMGSVMILEGSCPSLGRSAGSTGAKEEILLSPLIMARLEINK